MRLLMLLLVFLAGYTAVGVAQETNDVIELNPLDFVPLEVGDRWTYSHSYSNHMYYEWEYFWDRYGEELDEDAAYWEAYFKQFEIPGYLLGESQPPNSLLDPDGATLVVEITHTEWIDGFEYFVFSEVSYDWPPLPSFFWAGQKVRLSEDGVLLFHRNGTDIPLYDFSPQRDGIEMPSEWYNTSSSAFEYIPIEINRGMKDRLTFYPDHTDVVIAPAYRDQTLEVSFYFSDPVDYSLTIWNVPFVKGYGIGLVRTEIIGTGNSILFWNNLTPMSAILSGKEMSYEEATGRFVVEPDYSSVLGQLGKISSFASFSESGFDFSEGTESPFYFDEKKDDIKSYQRIDTHDGFGLDPPYLISYIGMADLGRADFGRLVSEGPADLRPDPPTSHDSLYWSKNPAEDNTYAFWTQEGGIALMHILDIKYTWKNKVDHILFNWVYYPVSDKSPETTFVQPMSWGQLKNSLLRTK